MDTAFLVALSAAFLLGVEHAFEPDHVAAVSTIVTQDRGVGKSLLTGSLWGLGHTLALLVGGIFVVLLRVQFTASISTAIEAIVGLMLIALGTWAIWTARSRKLHFHVHGHDGRKHAHIHSHLEGPHHDHAHIPFSVGIVHGLAGTGGLVILAMATMTNLARGLLFIGAFGGGLILAMSLIASALSLPITFGERLSSLIALVFTAGAGAASMALGLVVFLGLVF